MVSLTLKITPTTININTVNLAAQPPYNPDENTQRDTNEPYLDLVDYFLGSDTKDLPSVLSHSYGDDEQSVPYGYAVRVCRGYAALGARLVDFFPFDSV